MNYVFSIMKLILKMELTNDNDITVLIDGINNDNTENKYKIKYYADGVFKEVECCFRSSNVISVNNVN